jgi:hypothetical protein
MSKDLHVVPKLPLPAGQSWNKSASCLTLSKSDIVTLSIADLDDYINSLYSRPKPFTAVKEEVYKNMTRDSKDAYKKKYDQYYEAEDAYKENVAKERDKLRWAWQVVHKGINPDKIKHNNSFSFGISSKNEKQLVFPKLLEGGGLTWLETFTDNNSPIGTPPHGMFIRAMGVPKIIAAEWRDHAGKLITEKIAFGSTVYLHIYTEALFGEKIEIQLQDDGYLNDTNLKPTPSKDGEPIQKLDPTASTRFVRLVDVHKFDKTTTPAAGAIVDALITVNGDEQISSGNVQKCVFPVFIERAWQYQSEANFTSGSNLSINPIIYHSKINEGKIIIEDCVLKVSKDGINMPGELTGNNPLVIGEPDEAGIPDEAKKIDFTFGVFIDGTLNNRYNTEARQAFEERTGKKATSQKIVKDSEEKKYRYEDESSYENDLSNPAILFKNYLTDEKNEKHPIFKIYTEGIGTLTTPDENGQLKDKDYKDDNTVGYALGTRSVFENTGIKAKVQSAVEAMAKEIIKVMNLNTDKTIGSLTVDVFGFSRGAAAARNFVHEITYPTYYATMGIRHPYCDQHGNPVSLQYFDRKKPLPSNGHLGYLLTEANQKFDKLDIRFAGIYDTVPHHGAKQADDIVDLGLNSINKANYVVHLVAADEHRGNFNLAKISSVTKTSPESGKKGGIELYLPGVHCDVGGSYVEGMPENKKRIDASFSYQELKNLKMELVEQGWFNKEELIIEDGNWREINDTNFQTVITKMVLNSKRKYLSNQYSFIPLHMMVEFCEIKGALIKQKIFTDFKFEKNKIRGNVEFLNKIKKRLFEYAFEGGVLYEYQEAEKFRQPDVMYAPEQSHQVLQEYRERQIAGQKELDEAAYKKNKNIKILRNHYLHWNSVYGSAGIIDVVSQPHSPNKENGKRKRTEQ